MATNKRQRQESENLTETKTSTQSCTSNEEFIEAELAEVNDILQDDERSQKGTKQIYIVWILMSCCFRNVADWEKTQTAYG